MLENDFLSTDFIAYTFNQILAISVLQPEDELSLSKKANFVSFKWTFFLLEGKNAKVTALYTSQLNVSVVFRCKQTAVL